MQLEVNIGLQQLLALAKQLPKKDFIKFKEEINQVDVKENVGSTEEKNYKELILNGPVWSEEDLEYIMKNREDINRWRDEKI